MPAELLEARGAAAAEAALAAAVDRLTAGVPPAELALPVRVIVPSRSLRLHLAAALVRRRRGPVLGVTVQTLHSVALEVLERCGKPEIRGDALYEVLARRLAREERPLARSLDGLVDGYAAVGAAVRDLLDAGLRPELEEAALDALAAEGPAVATRAEVERARALVQVASNLLSGAEALGLGRASTRLSRAAELLASRPEALPCRAILVHGFADATGVAFDLLAELLRRPGALILDRPPDPAGDGAAEAAFTERLVRRLETVTGPPRPAERPPPGRSERRALSAVGVDGEVRAVAVRLRALLDAGARPEGIGVVARDLGAYGLVLRRHLRALAIPFSGVGGDGSLTSPGRRARALLELLARGADLPADRWLDATAALGGKALPARRRVDLRLACFSLGAGRLRDLAGLEVDRYLRGGSYALPVRQGLRAGSAPSAAEPAEGEDPESDDQGDNRAAGAPRRRVEGEHLRAAAAAAEAVCARLRDWPQEAPAAEHFQRLEALTVDDLGWADDAPESGGGPVLAALRRARDEVPPRLGLRFDEVRVVLDRALERVGRDEIGGRGGGVQLLGMLEARGRTFDHLFVVGVNRGVFPRTVRPDPLLPDALRRVLTPVLPEIPLKRRGFDEERYLFAQLLAAAPEVTLSWSAEGTDGRPLSPSPLVERLGAGAALPEPERAPAVWTAGDGSSTPRPAREHAVLAALHAGRRGFARVLPAAAAESRRLLRQPALDLDPDRVARVRLAVLDELDPDLSTAEGRAVRRSVGPYLGFVGALAAAPADDPRHRELYVTALERLATCPWQVFLERLLRLEPTPDPVQALPDVDALLLGNAVHRVLEELVRQALGDAAPETLELALAGEPAAVAWPDDEELERRLAAAADRLVEEEGVALHGMARALTARALPVLREAGASDWSAGTLDALGAEVHGRLTLAAAGGERRLAFKADRVDPCGDAPRLTDYKTGRPVSTAKQDTTRRSHFLDQVRAGRRLQAVAYALASGGRGRYLFLKPEIEAREFAADAGDRELAEAFSAVTDAAFGAWEAGAFFPRLVDPTGREEPLACSWCAVAEACLRRDSGARLRLHGWAEERGAEAPGGEAAPAARAALAVWDLADRRRRSEA